MKKFIISLIIATIALAASAQSDIFKSCEKIPDITTVYISKAMMSLIGSVDLKCDGVDLSGIASKVDNIEIIQGEDKAAKALGEKARSLTSSGYENLMRIKDDGENVALYMRKLSPKKFEYVLTTDEDDESTVIIFTGELTIAEVLAATGH